MAEKPEADPDRSAGLYRPIAKALLVAYGVAMVSVTATVAGWWDTGPVRPLMIGALHYSPPVSCWRFSASSWSAPPPRAPIRA